MNKDINISKLAILTLSARASAGASEAALRKICRKALRGKTADEPDLEDCARDIALRGFHLHAGMAWGIHFNAERREPELVRLITVSAGPSDSTVVGQQIH